MHTGETARTDSRGEDCCATPRLDRGSRRFAVPVRGAISCIVSLAALLAMSPCQVRADALPIGYQPRACGFDLNDDGVVGDPAHDCNLCDGVTLDPDGDGIDEDLLYISSQSGSDATGDGSPAAPYRTIQYAWNQADGPGDGAEDILCFTGIAEEEEIVPGTSGVAGVRVKPRSGNEARDFEFPSNPTMLVGWDTDNDGEYPPVDADDVAVLDGGGNHVDSGLTRAFRFGAENSYLEIAHFTARDYGRYVPVELDEYGNVIEAGEAGFVRFTTGTSGVGGHMFLHDLWIENINRDTVGGSHRITFDFFVGHTILHHLALINLKLPDNSSFLNRGAAPDLPGQGLGGRDYGPIRWQNLSISAHGKDQQPGVLGGFLQGWKLWGYMTGLEILDSELDANLSAWNVGTLSVDFVNATQCSRDWTIRNNLLLDVRDALTAQGGNGEFCAHDTVNIPPKSIPRTTDDVVFEGNVYINHHDQEAAPVQIKGGDDPQRSIEDVSISNNLFVTTADKGFAWCIKAAAANDTGPGNPGTTVVANNTCHGAVNESADRGAIVIGDTTRPAGGQQASVIVVNNIIAGLGDNLPRNIEMPRIPASLLLDANVYDSGGVYSRPGLFTADLSVWQGTTGWDGESDECTPAFQSVEDINLRLQPYDSCAKNAGADLGGIIVAQDLDGTTRPQQSQWDIGAYEAIEPDPAEPPLRYDGQPAAALAAGTTEATLSLRTYGVATCRYGTVAGTVYTALPFALASGDGEFHEAALAGLADGQSYEVFVRCTDGSTFNTDDYRIAFQVEAAPVTDLVAYWPMNENLGTTVSDASGNGNDASLLNGGAWAAGPIASAVDLDGQNDWMLVTDPGAGWILDLPSALTITAWVRPDSSSGQSKFVSKDNSYEFQMGHAGAGRYSIRLNNSGGGAGSTPVAAGQWQHLVASWDGQTVRYYYNGEPDGSSAFQATLAANNNHIGIGARPPGSNFLGGAIDEVRIYDGALTGAEVRALYEDTTPPPDTAPPLRGDAFPGDALPIGTTSALVGLRTDEAATCRYAGSAGVPYAAMVNNFASGNGLLHSATIGGLVDGQSYDIFVRCVDALAQANPDDFVIPLRVLRPLQPGFSPAAIADVEFYIQSTVFEDPAVFARSIATCNSAPCYAAGNLATIGQQYCDTAQFPGGCIRRWDDQSGYLPPGGFRPPEWIRGRNFGQDDYEKPLFIADCVNGHPCARGGSGAKAPDGSPLEQNFSFEVEVGQTASLPGEFSVFHLVRPVAQAADYQYFGLNGLIHRVADDSLAYRVSGSTVRLTPAGAVANGAWQLIEIHRRADGLVRVVVNGEDVTWNSPFLSGDAAGSNYLSRFKGDAPMLGDLAASISYSRRLDSQEIADVRGYLSGIYDYLGSVPVDTVPPLRSNGAPSGQLAANTTAATLSVETNEEASCRYGDAPGVTFDAMTETLASPDGRTHQAELADLASNEAYRFHVKCRDAAGNANADDYLIDFYIGEPGVGVGLLAYWPFEENGGDFARNATDPSLDGQLRNAPIWVAGQRGRAMAFDGVDQFAVVSDSGSDSPLDVTIGMTVAVWVRPDALPSSGAVKLLAKDNIFEFEIGHAGPGTYSARLNNVRRGRGTSLVEVGAWQHLAMTWDGTTVRYYVNGQSDGSAAFAGPMAANDNDAGIAARPVGSSGTGFFQGRLDELRLYARALSDGEIAELAVADVHCPALPAATCRSTTVPRKSRLRILDRGGDRDQLTWKWTNGAATSRDAIGHPAAGDDFELCLYDSVDATGRLLLEQNLPGASTCNGDRPCWKETTRGASWRDTGLLHGAIKKMAIRSGVDGKARITLAATGPALNPPPLPLSLEPWARIQLRNVASGECWEARFTDADDEHPGRWTALSD